MKFGNNFLNYLILFYIGFVGEYFVSRNGNILFLVICKCQFQLIFNYSFKQSKGMLLLQDGG